MVPTGIFAVRKHWMKQIKGIIEPLYGYILQMVQRFCNIENGRMDQEDRRSGLGTVAAVSVVGNGDLPDGQFTVPAPEESEICF